VIRNPVSSNHRLIPVTIQDEESLEQGIVFNREDAQSDKFKARRRIIPHDEFLEFASRVRDV